MTASGGAAVLPVIGLVAFGAAAVVVRPFSGTIVCSWWHAKSAKDNVTFESAFFIERKQIDSLQVPQDRKDQ